MCALPRSSLPSASGDRGELVAALRMHLDHVAANPPLELDRSPLGDRAAVVDDHNPAGELVGLVEVLGGEQHVGAAFDERADRVPELDPAARVEAGRRLVEKEQPWLSDQARAEVEPPAHASRVGADEPVGGLDEAELLEHPLGARRAVRRP